ncbi:hypothetical protein JYB88_01305 [Shewanella cyperi]|uniref:DUF805 domain-containing protein n=1 Tax=Shewanella cyperi TaxID=2814292 RepID=A0A975AKM9_9GAMM|nr:hypothetical protein [Shewanella cyperi]QSX30330.1 hypothetical protein JYB88_01305 [Shewanella cyperi]
MQYRTLVTSDGCDNGPRLVAIGLVGLLLPGLGALLFGAGHWLWALGLPLILVSWLSAKRRCRDSSRPGFWAMALVALMMLWLLMLTLAAPVAASLGLLALAGAMLGLLAAFPSHPRKHYRDGYWHMDMPVPEPPVGNRIEPSLGGRAESGSGGRIEPSLSMGGQAMQAQAIHERAMEGITEVLPEQLAHSGYRAQDQLPEDNPFVAPWQADANGPETWDEGAGWQAREAEDEPDTTGSLTELMQQILVVLQRWWRPMLALLALLAVVALVALLWPKGQDSEENAGETQPENHSREQVKLPDGLNLALEEEALLLIWKGERTQEGPLWSQATAKGDATCRVLEFNNGSQYRPLEVRVLASTDTEARFSPLDSRDIIRDMALRGSVSLCGYQFSLRGSQAVLEQQAHFAEYLP